MVTPPQETASPEVAQPESDSGSQDWTISAAPFSDDFNNADFFSDGDEGDEFLLGKTLSLYDEEDFFSTDEAEPDKDEDLSWEDDSEERFFGNLSEPEPELSLTEDTLVKENVCSAAEAGAEEGSPETVLTLAPDEAPAREERSSGSDKEEFLFGEGDPRRSLPVSHPPAELRAHSSRRWPWLLLLLVFLAGGAYLYQVRQQVQDSWQRMLIRRELIPVPPAGGAELKPIGISGYYLKNQREGRLFVVQGRVRNEALEARAIIVVQGRVYDKTGVQLAQQKAYCGNPMSEAQLAAWSMLRINERMQNQFGEMLANLNLEPQRSVPFTLVFKDLSGEVAEFEVLVVASEPVIK